MYACKYESTVHLHTTWLFIAIPKGQRLSMSHSMERLAPPAIGQSSPGTYCSASTRVDITGYAFAVKFAAGSNWGASVLFVG